MDPIVGARIIRGLRMPMTSLDQLILIKFDASMKDTIKLATDSSDRRTVVLRRSIL